MIPNWFLSRNNKKHFPYFKTLYHIHFPLLFPTDFKPGLSELLSSTYVSALSSRMQLPIRDALRNNPKQTRVENKFRKIRDMG